MLRWLIRNLGTLIIAFLLALVVWVSAVISNDPNEVHVLKPVPIKQMGQDPNLLIVGDVPLQVYLTLKAPRSVWSHLNNNPSLAEAWIDLAGLAPGEYDLPVKTRIGATPTRILEVDPQEVHIRLEPLVKRELPVQLVVTGEPPLGYKTGNPSVKPASVTISGPASLVDTIVQARAILEISGAVETVHRTLQVEALDASESVVKNVNVLPQTVEATQPVSLLGGFKNVVVKVVTKGQVANGYRLTNISVSPPTVTLFSDDPKLVEGIPGFVETLPVDLTNLDNYKEVNVGLNLPRGITLVREPSVLVQISVAAIEGSLTLTLPIQIIGLTPDLQANISPATVDVIVAGPLKVLDGLTPASFRAVLDLTGLPPGVYQRSPVIDLVPDQVRVQTTLPETVEVTIILAPTPTPTVTIPITLQPSLTPLAAPRTTPVPTPR
jgi:YbbR domain-containing protein